MNQRVEDITNNISFTLSNINVLKNLFLEENSVDNYHICNDLRISFKIFYEEIFRQVSNLNDADLSIITEQYQQIKLNCDRFNANKKRL